MSGGESDGTRAGRRRPTTGQSQEPWPRRAEREQAPGQQRTARVRAVNDRRWSGESRGSGGRPGNRRPVEPAAEPMTSAFRATPTDRAEPPAEPMTSAFRAAPAQRAEPSTTAIPQVGKRGRAAQPDVEAANTTALRQVPGRRRPGQHPGRDDEASTNKIPKVREPASHDPPTSPVGPTPPRRGGIGASRAHDERHTAETERIEPTEAEIVEEPLVDDGYGEYDEYDGYDEPTERRTPRRGPERSLGRALIATAAATVAPGAGHLLLRRRRTGAVILGVFLLVVISVVLLVMTADRTTLLENALSSRVLVLATIGALIAAISWMAVIVRTYLLARPRGVGLARQAIGVGVVAALCVVVAAPFGFGANLANSQRSLLDTLFTGGGGTDAAEAIAKPRLNILLVGSDAGPDRRGARTDTMMVASLDTKTGRTTLFSLPRNIERAQFPENTPMGEKFPDGFREKGNPGAGDYFLNAVYAWGRDHPADAPQGPTQDPGLNLLHQSIETMLGLKLDYFIEVDMHGFESIIDAVGGVTLDVGPERLAIGGIGPHGERIKPTGYIEPGVQKLDGRLALAFARARTNSSDYARMGRQRCLLQTLLTQKSPADILTNFQAVAAATKNSVSTNIPQQVLPALVSLAGKDTVALESVSFDPSLPDPDQDDGRFNTGDPNFDLMRKVVQDTVTGRPAAAPPTASTPTQRPTTSAKPSSTETPEPSSTAPTSLAAACG
ncbi:LCP family protein [Actinomycetes bacterium KLBMP 9759]